MSQTISAHKHASVRQAAFELGLDLNRRVSTGAITADAGAAQLAGARQMLRIIVRQHGHGSEARGNAWYEVRRDLNAGYAGNWRAAPNQIAI